MIIVGVGGSIHDLSCTLVIDGEIKISIDEERISGEKHGLGKRSHLFRSIDYCLNEMKLKFNDVDYIVSTDLLALTSLHKHLNKIICINHHLAHCASSYYTSGFDEAAGLVIDGMGTHYIDGKSDSISMYYANRNMGIDIIENMTCDSPSSYLTSFQSNDNILINSLGSFYSIITTVCGFGILQEGKTMGLAAFGKNTYVDSIKQFIKITFKNEKPSLYFDSVGLYKYASSLLENKNINDNFKEFADVAYAGQYILEDIIFKIMNYLHEITGSKYLVYSGGVALNSVLNGKIKKRTPFEHVFIFPAAGDAGTGIGAALYLYHNILKNSFKKKSSFFLPYLGKEYNELDIETCLKKYETEIIYKKHDYNNIIFLAATSIHEGRIIGWYQGRSEIGPRALGNRSILANPTIKEMKEILNNRVKFREHFRPFAPAVLNDHVSEYFSGDFSCNPYMLYVANVIDGKKEEIPAVVHVDGTARLQTVTREDNYLFYELINAYKHISNIPIVINTSFNIKGKPIVETPTDAIWAFMNSDMDDLFMGNYHIIKEINKY